MERAYIEIDFVCLSPIRKNGFSQEDFRFTGSPLQPNISLGSASFASMEKSL
jgi:hypothetical protein